ncbi:MAG: hypothetical protein V9G29_20350 [Burkholderiaceae bacterium]
MKTSVRWLPRSLVGRVFALYTVTLLAFVLGGLGLFYSYQFSVELEEAQLRADTLSGVIMPTISDSAVIGDYDTIRRTLERALLHSSFSQASFIDMKGGLVRAPRNDPPDVSAPGWLVEQVASRLLRHQPDGDRRRPRLRRAEADLFSGAHRRAAVGADAHGAGAGPVEPGGRLAADPLSAGALARQPRSHPGVRARHAGGRGHARDADARGRADRVPRHVRSDRPHGAEPASAACTGSGHAQRDCRQRVHARRTGQGRVRESRSVCSRGSAAGRSAG